MRLKLFMFIYFCFNFMINAALFADNNSRQTLTFSQAADLAVSASADLRHARSSQRIMERTFVSGVWEYFPRFGISVSENDRLQQFGADSFMKNYGISADQLIFNGGRTVLARNIERTDLKLASSRVDRMESDAAESAISAYRSVLSSRAILEIKKSALIIFEDQIAVLKEEVQLGFALPVDLASAQLNLADAKIEIYSLQLDLLEMERQFTELLGLDSMPVLAETVNIHRASVLPGAAEAAALAKEQNPDLIEARYSINKKRAELKYLSRSWIPSFRLNGNFGLSGQQYPLTKYNWSVGVNIELSSPWIQNRFSAQTGWEPPSEGLYNISASVQNNFIPFNNPPSRFNRKQVKLSLALEREKFADTIKKIGRAASNAVEKCLLAEQKRLLSLEAAALGTERCNVEWTRLSLGQITRIDIMEVLIEQTQREIAAVEAAVFLLEAERELERFLNLKPGELAKFAANAAALN